MRGPLVPVRVPFSHVRADPGDARPARYLGRSMRPVERALLATATAVLAAGVAGSVTIGTSSPAEGSHSPPATTKGTATTATSPSATGAPTTAPGPGSPGPDSAALAAGMLAPVDLGGFYRVNDPYASTVLSTAPCLAGVGPSQAQNGRAFIGLVVPGGHPAVTEVAASYPGSSAEQVFHSVNDALTACTTFSANLAGDQAHVQLSAQSNPQVGDESSSYGGSFNAGGRNWSLQLEVVLDGKIVLLVVYVDTIPPSNAIYGDLPSTVGAAIGKLA